MSRSRKKKPPVWSADYFELALERHQQLIDALDVSAAGIAVQRGMPGLIEALAKAKQDVAPGRLEEAKKRAKFADKEADAGYPTIAAFGTLAMWSWLEAFVLDFCVLWVRKRPSTLRNMSGPKIKVDLSDYARLSAEDRARFVVDALDRELSGPLKRGPARFENLLEAVGVPIRLSPDDKKTLFEFHMYRNCLAHRLGIIDGKLKDQCPWVEGSVGEPLSIRSADFHRFSSAAGQVLLETIFSAGDVYGVDVRHVLEDNGAKRKKAGHKANAKKTN